jgi:hypothetical protein
MKRIILASVLFFIVGCVQDSPNVKQIANLKFFIENQGYEGINVIEKGLQYAVLKMEIIVLNHRNYRIQLQRIFMEH